LGVAGVQRARGIRGVLLVSSPETTHSRNLPMRPQLSIVIFDSQAPVNTGQAVYMSGVAEELAGVELDAVSTPSPAAPTRR
jgi:hypothetical protein